MNDTDELKGKNAWLRAETRGIGRQVALALAQQGINVALNYNRSESEAKGIQSEIEKCGVRCIAVQADVSKGLEVQRMIAIIERNWYSANLY